MTNTDMFANGLSLRRHILGVGLLCSVFLIGGIGWASLAEVSGAVVAHGALVSDSYDKKVQHPTGGVISALYVHEGDRVKAGALLVRLDDTQTRANLAVFTSDMDQLEARRDRLLAEEGAATNFARRTSGTVRGSGERLGFAQAERRLMEARRVLRARQKAQLTEQELGENREIEGLGAQSRAHDAQIGLLESELKGVKELFDEGYAPMSAVKSLERQEQALDGERGQLEASAAGATNKIAGYREQAAQIDAQHLSEVLTDLADVQGKIAELVQKKAAAEDVLQHVELRAPQAGFVHNLTVHAVGAVITPSEPVLTIVPSDDTLDMEVKIPPQDIDQVRLGQSARVRFSAFDRRTTPEIFGRVTRISPDLEQDQRTGASYYLIRVALPQDGIKQLGEVRLLPGMPAEVYVQTGKRTVLSYMIKPLADQLHNAFREK